MSAANRIDSSPVLGLALGFVSPELPPVAAPPLIPELPWGMLSVLVAPHLVQV